MGDKVIPVKVAVRVRPLVPKEVAEGCQLALEVVDGEPQVFVPNTEKAFTYDYAFAGNSTNEEVYQNAVKEMVGRLFEGYNVTVLAYGQTGSGKTHSMGTAYKADTTQEMEGVIPRAVRDIFEAMTDKTDMEFKVTVSFIELYNEQLFDLLSSKARKEDAMVDIREDGKGGIKIPGLTEAPVGSVEATMGLLERSSEGRVTAATAMNKVSSRSHAIFTLTVETKPGPSCANQGVTVSRFHLVDLAGSERQKKTKANGERLKEGININMGLLSLGNVISALGDENRGPNSHIPYRDSKLTRLLQDSLGGNSHTLMVACVSPADSNLEETISTLRYADRARKIKNKPIVNKDPKAAELSRLRSQVQELQMRLLDGGAASPSSSQDSSDGEENKRLVKENSQLNAALQAAMEENAHINEKLLLSELSQEKMKEKLAELEESVTRATNCFDQSTDVAPEQRTMMAALRHKVAQVQELQQREEKTIVEHDITRFNNSANVSGLPETDEGEGMGGASHTLKQSELATQLNNLNKELAAKQQLAGTIGESDVKLNAMKKRYEEVLKTMEEEMTRLQKEKDELAQVQRGDGAGATKDIAERRRKKIQELEEKIGELKKKQVEQQRMANMATQNEAQAKKYQEEIGMIKAAKVKLVKQMKEEADRVRVWKQTKEKEVIQLKQKDRKKEVAISKMTVQHERQQKVMKRRMEEVLAINKRLKDAQEKKALARAGKPSTGLTGAGERVRGWVKDELDVVVSYKEAEQARQQLIKERKACSEEMAKLRVDTRRTMTSQELEETSGRQTELQEQLDMKNLQIAELQKNVMKAEQDKEKSGDRWSRINNMTDAKLAVTYLFNSATESLASFTTKSAENRELKQQIEELTATAGHLKEKISQLKMEHQTEKSRMTRESESNVLTLLNQMYNTEEAAAGAHDASVTKDIIDKVVGKEGLRQQLDRNEQVTELEEEVARLRAELMELRSGGASKVFLQPPIITARPHSVKKAARRTTLLKPVTEQYTEEEFFEEFFEDSSSGDDSTTEDEDDEWRKTPMGKRIKTARQSLAVAPQDLHKRKRPETIAEDGEKDSSKARKKSAPEGCGCKTGCKTKACKCRKAGPYCSPACRCTAAKCSHREDPGSDVSCNSTMDTDKENELNESGEETADTTDKLLNGTFDLPGKLAFSNPSSPSTPAARTPLTAISGSIFKTPNSGADMFAAESDVEETPKARTKAGAFFAPPYESPVL